MVRVLPDVDRMLALHLNAALPAAVTVSNHVPADVLGSMPYVRVARFGGGDVHPRFGTSASVDVDCWESTRQKAADLAEDVRVALVAAWQRQTPLTGGTIARLTTTSAPSELRTAGQLAFVFRYTASLSLLIRP